MEYLELGHQGKPINHDLTIEIDLIFDNPMEITQA